MAALSGCQFWQADGGSIAQRCDGFQCHVSGALCCPFIVLLEEEGADEPDHGGFVREDADDIGAAFDLAIEPFERVGIGYASLAFRRGGREAGRVVFGQPGQGSSEHGRWAGRCHSMSCELALVVGRPCDPPGCAASADP